MANLIDPGQIRAVCGTHPDLTETQRALLGALSSDHIQRVVGTVLSELSNEDAWLDRLEEVREAVVKRLIEALPDPNRLEVGTYDQCAKCLLPITLREGARWRDDIMGSDACRNGGDHLPKEADANYRLLVSRAMGQQAVRATSEKVESSTAYKAFVDLASADPTTAYLVWLKLESVVQNAEYPRVKIDTILDHNGEPSELFVSPYSNDSVTLSVLDSSFRCSEQDDESEPDFHNQVVTFNYDEDENNYGTVVYLAEDGLPVRLPEGWSE